MKIVLFGSTGMLGYYVYHTLKQNNDIYTITRKQFDIENDPWINLDILLNNISFELIINCAGAIPQKYKENDSSSYKSYIRVNSLFPHQLMFQANKHKSHFIHITTDCVFDGKKGSYVPEDSHTSTTLYGISKSLGEPLEATIIRTSILGEEQFGKKSLLEWVKSHHDTTLYGYTNQTWNGVTCYTLSSIIKTIIEQKNFWIGIRHIHSSESVTKYDLCRMINDIYKLNNTVLPSVSIQEKNMTLTDHIIVWNPNDTIQDQIIIQKKVFHHLF